MKKYLLIMPDDYTLEKVAEPMINNKHVYIVVTPEDYIKLRLDFSDENDVMTLDFCGKKGVKL